MEKHESILERLAEDDRLTDAERAAVRWALGEIARLRMGNGPSGPSGAD